MTFLKDKRVLMFAPKFFGYENEISKKIKEKCADCVFFDERAEPSVFEKICIRLNYRKIIMRKITSYYQEIINTFSEDYFDYVIFFNPETITVELLKKLKEKQKSAKFILYMWDSFGNKPHTKEILPYFEKKYSFNKKDCDGCEIKFRPLFFIDTYDSDKNNLLNQKNDIDIGFIGTIHSDRYKILKKLRTLAEECGLKTNYYMFFPNKLLYYKYKFENWTKEKICINDFKFVSLNSSEVLAYLNKCKTVIDIQHPKQIGLTMRTIEMLGLKKKLITTNTDIVNYDFYNENNICVIDRENIKIDKSFFASDYNYDTDNYREKYSLDFFINELLLGK